MRALLLLLLLSNIVFAQDFKLENIVVVCSPAEFCEQETLGLKTLPKEYYSIDHLNTLLKNYLLNNTYKKFEYSLIQEKNKFILSFKIKKNRIVNSINFVGIKGSLANQVKRSLPIKENEAVTEGLKVSSLKIAKEVLVSRGFKDAEVRLEEKENVDLNFYVKTGQRFYFKNIEVISEDEKVSGRVKRLMSNLEKKKYNQESLRQKLESINESLISEGFYHSKFRTARIDDENLAARFKLGDKFHFSFSGNKFFNRQKLIMILKTSLVQLGENFVISKGAEEIQSAYQKIGFRSVKVKGSIVKRNYKGIVNNFISYEIRENERTWIRKILFKGNKTYSKQELKKIFFDKGSKAFQNYYYNEARIKSFSAFLENTYTKKGYLFTKVSKPFVIFHKGKDFVDVSFSIEEGLQTIVSEISFSGLEGISIENLKKEISLKKGSPFNPQLLESDYPKVSHYIREQGFYFSRLEVKNLKDLVSYSEDYRTVKVHYSFNLGRKLYAKEIIVLGLKKTKKKIIDKESPLKRGELITPLKLEEVKQVINSLGLFSTVNIKVLQEDKLASDADVLISVKEKDYGLVEVAPGFRTDLGLKLSSEIRYDNVGSMNRRLALKGQLNQRTSYSMFDLRRQTERRKRLEYSLLGSFNEPYLFNSRINYNAAMAFSRRRFFSFDAEIAQITNTFSKFLSPQFSISLKHQFETIQQFDATNQQDQGSFRIGGLTPAFVLDLRNDQANPTKGALFNYSVEFANPAFLSQKEGDLEINFYKFIGRHNFYIPLKRFGTLAFSISGGMQKNLATGALLDESGANVINANGEARTKGNIPSIKVFRLSGIDLVRGFDDSEINRLDSGQDISSSIVQSTAYFTNFKLEPRYFLNDSSMIGLFIDAGRVSVNHFNPLEFRSSAGLTLRYITPVGALSLDYGFKLHRARLADGSLESPGRFHLSLGSF